MKITVIVRKLLGVDALGLLSPIWKVMLQLEVLVRALS